MLESDQNDKDFQENLRIAKTELRFDVQLSIDRVPGSAQVHVCFTFSPANAQLRRLHLNRELNTQSGLKQLLCSIPCRFIKIGDHILNLRVSRETKYFSYST